MDAHKFRTLATEAGLRVEERGREEEEISRKMFGPQALFCIEEPQPLRHGAIETISTIGSNLYALQD